MKLRNQKNNMEIYKKKKKHMMDKIIKLIIKENQL